MKFDRFETRIDRTAYVTWPNGGGYQPIEFCINDVSFIKLLRRAELPNAEAEFDAHIIAGEKALTLEPRGGLATITVDPTSVTWSDFCQFHRAWQYDLGPFTFERANYEAQLVNKL